LARGLPQEQARYIAKAKLSQLCKAMRAIVALTCVALACGQVLKVPDYFHYLDSSAIEHEKLCNGVLVTRWPAQGEPPHFRTLNPMGMSRITIPKNGQYPDKDGAYWLTTEATYVVVAGKANMTFENGTEIELLTGDLFYSPGGIKHGPIKNRLEDDAIVMALADLHPEFGEPPAIIPGASSNEQYAFLPREYMLTGSPDLPDCLTLSIYNSPNGQPGAISANLEANCELPFHYHATGVLYFYTEGVTTVGGDGPEPVEFHPGEARWARPGWTYGPELAGKTHTQFMVLGLPPDVTDHPPQAELLVTRDVEPNPVQVAYHNTQYSEHAEPAKPELHEMKTRRVRKHLRSTAEEDHTVFLQSPADWEEDEEQEL